MTDRRPADVARPRPAGSDSAATEAVAAVGPAGSAAGKPARGAASSGRIGRTYVPEAEAEQADVARPEETVTGAPPLPDLEPGRVNLPTQTMRTAVPGPAPRSFAPPLGAAVGARPRKGVRRARLRLSRIDPWSALKVSLVFAAFLFVVWMIAVVVLFAILQGAGVFASVNSTLSDVLGAHVDFSGAVILGGAAVIGALSVVIVTALGTVAAFAYNVTASLLGGLDVTLTEQE